MLGLIIHYVVVMGQSGEHRKATHAKGSVALLPIVVEQLTSLSEQEDRKWCYWKFPPKNFLGIRHRPEKDFNIYLTYHHTVTAVVRTAVDISLNYAGVFQLRGMIALRKKN